MIRQEISSVSRVLYSPSVETSFRDVVASFRHNAMSGYSCTVIQLDAKLSDRTSHVRERPIGQPRNNAMIWTSGVGTPQKALSGTTLPLYASSTYSLFGSRLNSGCSTLQARVSGSDRPLVRSMMSCPAS